MHWASLILGWPTAITALLLSGIGLLYGRWLFLLLGALVGLPFMLYMSLFWPALLAVAAAHWAAVLALRQERKGLAWLLFLPTPAVTALIPVYIGLSAT